MYLGFIRILVFIGLMATSASGAELVGQKTVTDDWYEFAWTWNRNPMRPTYVARWKTFTEDGVMVICGAGTYAVGYRVITAEVTRDLYFYMDETPYLKNMSFFAKINFASRANRLEKLVGATANCASTGKPRLRAGSIPVRLRLRNPNKRY